MVTIPSGTNSTINNPFHAGANITSTGLATNIIIAVGNTAVGAIQKLNIRESRAIQRISEVGTDGAIDSAPHQSTDISGSCDRIRFDGMRIAEAFGRGFIHAKSQRYPFNIFIYDRWRSNESSPDDASSIITTTIQNVWIQELSTNISASDWIIVDSMNWVAETIYSTLGANSPAATGGIRGIPLAIGTPTGNIEQNTDVSTARGSLSTSGLVTAFNNF